ncbi:GNAT family N-acetyltransferase [Paenibacillus sp. DYY-L-2]|uniref:GNAT family N-acetyltransferase n=1 Tax=Paenibacillus sp. DYY-L-2 TaxID=3447013 RepID=UPI003F4F9D60
MDNTRFPTNRILAEVERIVSLEMELTRFNALRALSPEDKKLEVLKMGSASLLLDPASPQSTYYNRVIGLGPGDLDKLPEIMNLYGRHGISPCIDMTPDKQSGEVAEALSALGYVPRLQLAFLSLEVDRATVIKDEQSRSFRLDPVTLDNAEEYLGMIARSNGGMRLEEDVIGRKKGYFCKPEFRNWIVRSGEEPAAMGSLFIRGEEGYIANDFTFPQFRGGGYQTALIRERIRTAKATGLTRLYADVEFGSVSHHNMLKAGFHTVFVNSFWIKVREGGFSG